MPISSLPKHLQDPYFATLTRTSHSKTEVTEQMLNRFDALLQQTKLFNKVLFIKNLPFLLDQTQYSMRDVRLLKGAGTALGLIASAFLMSISGHIIPTLFWPLGLALGGFVGWSIPELYLKDRLQTYQFYLQHAVPDFLEQLHMMSASTGFESFGQALKLIAPTFPRPLGTELRKLTAIQGYLTEQELLDRLVKVCPHPLLKELALSIKLSSQFGSSLSEKTERLVETAQVQQEQLTKDLGNKTSGILLGPLLLFHLPALLIIFLIPFLFMLSKGI